LQKCKIPYLALSRKKIDLTQYNSKIKLARYLKPKDCVVFIAAKAPVKSEEMLIKNIEMCSTICSVIKNTQISHLIYISSDAVYSDSLKPLKENSITLPSSLHGLMHLSREIMLKNIFKGAICFIRPTLIYGDNDPHNGYGPNRFFRLAKKNKDIKLFGKGEELRDHVWVDDVAEIILQVISKKTQGIVNIATGNVLSFKKIAKLIVKITSSSSKIKNTKRKGPMPHNGYRSFNLFYFKKAFPNFKYKKIEEIFEKIKENY
jgi:UDP-glucose 4-epimerase